MMEKVLATKDIMLSQVAHRPDLVVTRGEGVYFFDTEGKRYLDLMAGWGSNGLGHSSELLQSSIREQVGRLMHAGPFYYTDKMLEFGAKLLNAAGLQKVFFTSTGAEANENAVKLARKYGEISLGGAYKVITFTGGFHGRTLAMMSATGKKEWERLFEPKVPGFIKVLWGDLAATERAIEAGGVAAIFLEPIQGEGGVNVPTIAFMKGLRELATQHGILLMLDEVQTGIGRTGKLFAFEHFGIRPDVLTLAKAIGGGFPLGAVLARREYALFDNNDIGATYTGQALGMVVGMAILEQVQQPAFLEHINTMHNEFCAVLKDLSSKGLPLSNIRGKGLMIAFDVEDNLAIPLMKAALLEGVGNDRLVINSVRPSSIRILPPYIIEKEHVGEFGELFARAYRHVWAQKAG